MIFFRICFKLSFDFKLKVLPDIYSASVARLLFIESPIFPTFLVSALAFFPKSSMLFYYVLPIIIYGNATPLTFLDLGAKT
jgi:hypothetical protein